MTDKNLEIIKVIQSTGKVTTNIPMTKIKTNKTRR
jgi:hypothetical protein